MSKMRALSIRQPFAEKIITGDKSEEYRATPTKVRGRVYIYACKTPGDPEDYEDWEVDPDSLTHGALIGTVEIVDCTVSSEGDYAWHLANPERLAKPLKVTAMPQPRFFYPFGQ